MKEIVRYSHCFVCGDKNKHGLKARFFDHDGEAISEINTDPAFEGYRGLYHGGILSTLLDEVMIKAILARGIHAVTAEMTIRFRKPVRTGANLRLAGRIIRTRGRVHFTEGEAVDSEGKVCATAKGTYIEAGPDMKSVLLESLKPE